MLHSNLHFRVFLNNLDQNHAEIMKLVGKAWHEASEQDKQPFVEMADLDKIRFADEMKRYNEKKSIEISDQTESPKHQVESSDSELLQLSVDEIITSPSDSSVAPSINKTIIKPKSLYKLFVDQIRPLLLRENPTADAKKIQSLVKKAWKLQSPEYKENLKTKFNQDVARYKEEMDLNLDLIEIGIVKIVKPERNKYSSSKKENEIISVHSSSHSSIIESSQVDQVLNQENEIISVHSSSHSSIVDYVELPQAEPAADYILPNQFFKSMIEFEGGELESVITETRAKNVSKIKKAKDPKAPKGVNTAYNYFKSQKYAILKAISKGTSF